MSYEHKDWVDGEELTPDALDNIEVGVMSVNSGYVPYDWENGDVVTAERLNHIEDGIVNAFPQRANADLEVTNSTRQTLNITYYGVSGSGVLENYRTLAPGQSGTYPVYSGVYTSIAATQSNGITVSPPTLAWAYMSYDA